ncbi:MAG: DUF1722 domain-containing protein [Gemmatimonadales bacterium]|nr:DUF1722 domain-containing protein [Gemmatimonadales bacterium]NIN12972.1 DUF1722 domain-containing protein [Gemmatimonadales bacterium]NIR02647.1 DUF1722 domain-containing protein [Gemmatimonadales bacterium]NIS67223.1 DUF1722 domain-containing protein [Gemmatimonadales bacterium]
MNDARSTRDHPRPTLVISKCLELEACRYNGERIRAPFIIRLEGFVELRPVCPEIEIGLGVPRDPIRLVSLGDSPRLTQPSTGRDLTLAMTEFTDSYLSGQHDADGFILKSRSPSCGLTDVKRYHPNGQSSGKGAGMFGGGVMERFPHAAVEDEGRLTNFRLRHHFLTKLFARASFRAVKASGSMARLVRFHSEQKFLLMAYHQGELRRLGRIVANPERHATADVLDAYEEHFSLALAKPARSTSNINVLMHALGYFSDALAAGEKRHFLTALDHYRAKHLALSAPLAIVQSWIARFGQEYLAGQSYFEPYPIPLLELRDSAREVH